MTAWLPALVLALALVLAGGLRAWVQHRRTGAWGVLLFRDRRPMQLIRDGLFLVLGLSLGMQAGVVAMKTESAPSAQARVTAGVLVAGLGLVVLCVAQLQLCAAWRMGIEWSARPGLVTRGLYRWSRNPIYAGLFGVILGYALLLPTPLSWAALLIGAVVIRMQVLEEERYLAAAYGAEFAEYARRVGRFLPGFGRLHPIAR